MFLVIIKHNDLLMSYEIRYKLLRKNKKITHNKNR